MNSLYESPLDLEDKHTQSFEECHLLLNDICEDISYHFNNFTHQLLCIVKGVENDVVQFVHQVLHTVFTLMVLLCGACKLMDCVECLLHINSKIIFLLFTLTVVTATPIIYSTVGTFLDRLLVHVVHIWT